MENIKDYIVDFGELTFAQLPFNEIDSLIFAQIAYTDLKDVPLDEKMGFYFRDLYDKELLEHVCRKTWIPKLDVEMIYALASSARYKDLRILDTHEVEDVNVDGQFTAYVVDLDDETIVLVNRGTDASFSGWAESLALSYEAEVPAQTSAKRYLEKVAEKYRKNIIMTGHSKGGNLVAFAASTVSKDIQARILKVYNLDGPGFLPEFYNRPDFNPIPEKICLYLPKRSVFGLLLDHIGHARVIESKGIMIEQHYPYNWIVRDGHFVRVNDVDNISKLTNNSINKWLESVDRDQRKQIIQILFGIFESTGASDFRDVIKGKFEMLKKLKAGFDSVDEDKIDILKASFGEFFDILKNEVFSSFSIKK